MGVNSLPKTVIRQRRGCNLNPGPTAPESSTLTTRLSSHRWLTYVTILKASYEPGNCVFVSPLLPLPGGWPNCPQCNIRRSAAPCYTPAVMSMSLSALAAAHTSAIAPANCKHYTQLRSILSARLTMPLIVWRNQHTLPTSRHCAVSSLQQRRHTMILLGL